MANKKKTESTPAIVRVLLPNGCKKTNLSIDALDSYTRELALKTQIRVGGKPLFCRSVKLVDNGNEQCLQITVRPGSFSLDTSVFDTASADEPRANPSAKS